MKDFRKFFIQEILIQKALIHVFSKNRQNRIFDSVAISDLYMLIPDLSKGTDFANVKSGDITWDRKIHKVIEYEDKDSESQAVISFDDDDGKIDLLVFGSEANDLPSGMHTYL